MRFLGTLVVGILLAIVGFSYYQGWLVLDWNYPARFKSPLSQSDEVKMPTRLLDEFSFDRLRKRTYQKSSILLEKVLETNNKFTSYLFSYMSDGRRVTGIVNIPVLQSDVDKAPVIVMIRGYVDRDKYYSGLGTNNAAKFFAKNGYITLAPDFLGYGDSDQPVDSVFWERLHKPIEVVNLIKSVGSLPQADTGRIGIWGHSNGGQIALSVLEVTGGDYPTSLWAPVSAAFPYSILYYTDEFDDLGLRLRYELAEFEKLYDVNDYSIVNYFDWIAAPIILHQGKADDAVPLKWSNKLVEKLQSLDKVVTYYVYDNAGHNMEGSWNEVVERDLEFYNKNLIVSN